MIVRKRLERLIVRSRQERERERERAGRKLEAYFCDSL